MAAAADVGRAAAADAVGAPRMDCVCVDLCVPVAVVNRRSLVVKCNSVFTETFGVSTGTLLSRLLTSDSQATLQ